MKSKFMLFLLIPILLSGCGFDEAFEKDVQDTKKDGDDINIIQEIGPQYIDRFFELRSQKKVPLSSQTGQDYN